ncbi:MULTISPECIES: 4-coumarate--CoA ligase [unclassified Rhizobium]|uniref:AMP-binding enzyme n=1 Tax=unclassified Rhizobium TaxID=2613769 RepID=UPI0013866D3C|nr:MULTISPECIES: 4-coumarate--CoA ligase [unclassified Rhizobium]
MRASTAGSWSEDLSMGRDDNAGLGLDSLEMMMVGSAINEMFHLYEGEQDLDPTAMDTFGDWLDAIEAAWADGVSKMTFLTSGSTGLPKRCVHGAAVLNGEAGFLAGLFTSRRRIIALAPAHHIYGCLLTAFLADRLSVDVISGATSSPRFLNNGLLPGDLVVSFPDRWAAIDRTVSTWVADVEGVVSTAPCPAPLMTSLIDRGLGGMTELYGSSETAGIGWRRHPSDRYTLMPHWSFENDRGEVAAGVRLRGLDGAVHDVPDTIERITDRAFTVGSRRDGAVQIGGINVWPQRIAAVLEQHPKVQAASVRVAQMPAGARLKAFVVPVSSCAEEELSSDLETWCRQRLSEVECPRIWTFGATLPVNEFGKAADWRN